MILNNIHKNAVLYFEKLNPNIDSSKLDNLLNNSIILEKIDILLGQGLKENQTISLLENMPNLLLLSKEELDRHLCFIYNSDILYAVLLLNNNSYEWSCYNLETEQFQKTKLQVFDAKTREISEDAMIRTLIDSTFRDDIIKYAKIDKDDNLEIRMFKLKQLKANSNGYRIK